MVGNSTQGIPHNPLVNKTVATLDARGPGARQSTVVPPMMVKKVRTTVYKVLNPLYTSVFTMVFPRTTSTTIYGTYDFWQRILKHNQVLATFDRIVMLFCYVHLFIALR